MDQRWTGLPLPVIFLLFWRNADGFKYGYPPPPSNFKECAFSGTCGTHSNSNHGWGQPSDAFSPPAVQSSMSEVHVTGSLPIEEVGSSLFPKKTLKSKSKLNPLQFVKGGSSIHHRSTSHAQTASSSSVSTTLPLSLNQQPSSYLVSSGSTIPGVADGLSLERYPEMSSQFQPLVVSSQSTNSQSSPSLHMVKPQSSSKSTDDATPLYTRGSVSYRSLSSQSHGSANSHGNSGAKLSANLVPKRVGSGYYSGMLQSLSTSSPYTPGSLMAKKLDSLPLGVSSQSTNVQSSPSLSSSSTQSRSATSRYVIPVQGGSSSVSLSHKSPGTLGQYSPMSPTKYASAPMSAAQATTNSRSSYRAVSQAGSLSQMGASGQFTSLVGKYYRGFLPQSQATSSPYALGHSKPFASPHSTGGLAGSVLSSRKQYNSGAQFGASTGLASQGMSSSNTGPVPSQGTTSPFAPGASPYASASLSLPKAGPSSTVPASGKQLPSYTGSSGTQAGSSTPFILHGSTASGASHHPQNTASPSAFKSPSSYTSVSLSSSQAGPSSTGQGSRKQHSSTYMGRSGTQAGSSSFTLQGSTASDGLPQPQGPASLFSPGSPTSYPGSSLSSTQTGSSTVPGSLKQLIFSFMGSPDTQTGSSTPFILQGSTASGGQHHPADAASLSAPGSPSYASLSLSLSQAGPSTTLGSQKQFTSAYQGGSGAQIGASADFASQEMTSSYSGSLQSPGTTNQFAPESPSSYTDLSFSSPQAGPVTFLGFLKQHASPYIGTSGTEAGPSSFTLQGSTASGGLHQSQDTASQFFPGYPSSYPGLSLSSPQAGLSTILGSLKQLSFTLMGNPSTQAGFSSPFSLQGSISYDGSPEPPGTASQFAPVSHSCPCALSPSQGVSSQSTIQGSQKKLASNFAGSSGTQAGSSTAILQRSTASGGSSQP